MGSTTKRISGSTGSRSPIPTKIQPERFSLVVRGNQEFLPVPPRHDVGTVWLHGNIGKVRADWISHPGRGAQIHAEIWIRINLVLYQRRKDSRGNTHGMPALRAESSRGDDVTFLLHLAGRLQRPAVPQ